MPICDYMAICDYCQSAILDNLYYNVYCFIDQRDEHVTLLFSWFTVIMKVIKLVILILFDQISDFLILWRPSWIYAN